MLLFLFEHRKDARDGTMKVETVETTGLEVTTITVNDHCCMLFE